MLLDSNILIYGASGEFPALEKILDEVPRGLDPDSEVLVNENVANAQTAQATIFTSGSVRIRSTSPNPQAVMVA